MLNIAIVSRDTFTNLLANISQELTTKISVIKQLKDIDEIKSKLIYIRAIRSRLWDQRDRMFDLRDKIESLVGTKEPRSHGRLSKIADKIKTFRTKHQHEYSYLAIVHIPETWRIHKIAEMRPWLGEQIEIENIEKTLKQILGELIKYISATGTIHDRLVGYKSDDIAHGKKIKGDIDKLDLFNSISRQNKYYKIMLQKAYRTLEDLERFGKLVKKNTRFLKKGFRDDVDMMTSVTYKELNKIYLDIEKEKSNTDEIRKGLENNNLVLDYSKTIHDLKENLAVHVLKNGDNHIGNLIVKMKGILAETETGQINMEDKWQKMIQGIRTEVGTTGTVSERAASDDAIQYQARLSQLHSDVNLIINRLRLSIDSRLRLLNILKSINETLEKVKGEAKELKGIGENLRDAEHYVGFM